MQRWFEISKDPNSPEVRQWRQKQLIAARTGKLIENRAEYLASLAKGKDVLDIGVVEHTRQAMESPHWLHRHLVEAAKTCLGVDILEDEVAYLKTKGYNVLCADVTATKFDRDFDLIVCGEVLEHLDSPVPFVASIAKLLRPGGRLAVSVPNPWYLNMIVKNLFNGSPYTDSADHASWFDPCSICEVGQRCGLSLDRYTGVGVIPQWNWRTRLLIGMQGLWTTLGIRPEVFAKSVIYEFVRTS